jgi:hypothetical protein
MRVSEDDLVAVGKNDVSIIRYLAMENMFAN